MTILNETEELYTYNNHVINMPQLKGYTCSHDQSQQTDLHANHKIIE